MTLSVVIHTLNEESNIQACLRAVAFADERVVVDNGSTDRTVRLALDEGAKVATFRGQYGYPEPARVFGLSQLGGDWVLIVDADERVSPELGAELQDLMKNPRALDGYWVPIRNHHFGRWLRRGGLYPDYHLRFFRRGRGGYPEVGLHRGLKVEGETGRLRGALDHYSYRDLTHYFKKFNTYTTVEAERIVAQGRRPTGYDLWLKPFHRWVKNYFFRGGFRDGLPGFLFHAFSSAYIFASEAKAWEAWKKQGVILPIGSTLFKRKK